MKVELSPVLRLLSNRFAQSVFTLWLVTVLFFLAIELVPFDFATATAHRTTTREMMEALRYQLGLNDSAPVRYFNWLTGFLRGDLGVSWWAKQPITPLITERLWHSGWLFGWAVVITVPISFALALVTTAWHRGRFDRASSMVALVAISLPDFVVAYAWLVLLAVYFDVFPAFTIYALNMPWTERLYASALPILSLVAITVTPMFRLTRAALINILSSEYIQMAELKGLGRWRILLVHALPNAVGPIANAVSLSLANLFFGLVIIEVIFSYPGMGSLLVIAATLRDMPLVQACGIISALVYISFSFFADSISLLANPRLRFPAGPVIGHRIRFLWLGKGISRIPRTAFVAIGLIAISLTSTLVYWVQRDQYTVRIVDVATPVSDVRDRLTASALHGESPYLAAPVHYDYFAPYGDGQAASHTFSGTLQVPRFGVFQRHAYQTSVTNEDVFPAFSARIISHGNVLLPIDRDRLLKTSDPKRHIILSPGRVWREPADGNWSRASLPFTLTAGFGQHYGVATFLFNDQSISQLRIQIAQETANWAQQDIWGQSEISYLPEKFASAQRERDAYDRVLTSRLTVRPWSELAEKYWRSLESYDGEGNRRNITVSGLMVDDIFYLRPCRTRAGPHPYCREMRHEVFSVSKSMGAAVAMLWLAQKYGVQVFDEKLTDYVSIPANHNGWDKVTFGNALDMTTGIGNVVPQKVPYYVESDSTVTGARVWWAPTIRGKLDAMAEFRDYPWEPGEVTRYRSSDTIALTAAMEAFLQSKEGTDVDFWDTLIREVYLPLGIDRVPVRRTVEVDGSRGTPLLDAGLFVTFEEALKIARLLQDHGEFNGRQLLHRALTRRTVSTEINRGLPSGWRNREGGLARYEKSFWLTPHKHRFGCSVQIPHMSGFGGNYVHIMPNRTIGLRFADGHDDDPATWDNYGIRNISDRIRSFCQ